MPTEEQVREALRDVRDPEIGKPIEDLGMLESITLDGGTVRVHVLLTIPGCPLRDRINTDVAAASRFARGGRQGRGRVDAHDGRTTWLPVLRATGREA